MIIKGENSLWQSVQVVIQSAITSGLDVKNFAESVVPSGSKIAFICRDDIDESSYVNNQLIMVSLTNGAALSGIRYRNSNYSPVTSSNFTTPYDFKATAGDTYTIFYQ